MAYAATHALFDGQTFVFWDDKTNSARTVTLRKGDPIWPHAPSKTSEIIYAGGYDENVMREQIAKWKAASEGKYVCPCGAVQ